MTTYIRDEESLHTAGRVITTCVYVCTRLWLRSVLGLGLALGSYRVYHTAGRLLILHRYRTPVAVAEANDWMTASRLRLNPSKTQVMSCGWV